MPDVPRIPADGKITRGISPNTLVDQTISFVENQLHVWRDDETRAVVEAEDDLNAQLCKYLNDRARYGFPMAYFHPEERQRDRRRVDLSVLPSSNAIEAAIYGSIYEPFLVIEGKRLPAPSRAREREYLTGMVEKSGGVQRFRLCLHGGTLAEAVLVGYVQTGRAAEWFATINGWITALTSSGEDETCEWTDADRLTGLRDGGTAIASRCESTHSRSGGVAPFRLTHLWIVMPARKGEKIRKRKHA